MSAPSSLAVGWELTNTNGSSNKFYRIIVQGAMLLAVYGPIGALGQRAIRPYKSNAEAEAEAIKVTKEKARGGYLLATKATLFSTDARALASLRTERNADTLKEIKDQMDRAADRRRTRLADPAPPDLLALQKALNVGAASAAAPRAFRQPSSPQQTTPNLGRFGPARRPSGEVYHPRSLGGQQDLAVLRAARRHGDGTLLYGPPGTGKTAMVEAAYPDAVQYVGHADTEVTDLVGSWISDGSGAFVWEPGPLQISVERDVPFFVDEIALINPSVLSVLYPLLDGRGELQIVTQSGRRTLTRGPGWVLVGAYNPDVPGAHVSEALLDRFALHVEVTTDFSLARELDVPADMVTVAENLERKRGAGEVGWAPQLRTLLQFRDNLKRYGTQVAVSNLITVAPSEDRDEVIEVVKSKYSEGTGTLRLGRRTL